jgi:hypothetical protein
MNTYRYNNGGLESIEPPAMTDLKWTGMGLISANHGEDYAWYCGLPSEEMVGEVAGGFNMAVYRATSDRAPYPFMAVVGFGGDCEDEIYFPQLGDIIDYASEHAPLLHTTVLAGVANRIDEAMKWLFDAEKGLFREHVQQANYRAYKAAEARRAKRTALGTEDGRRR